MTRNFNKSASDASTKVPEVTLAFWIIKIAATALGETASDSVTMTFDWGYLTGTAMFLPGLVAPGKALSPPSKTPRSSL